MCGSPQRLVQQRLHFPADFEKLQQYVKEGRWFPAGSSMEEGDVNTPSAETIIRQVLYGNNWFRKEFGKASAEYMIPDCFGFPASLPTILAHSGEKAFPRRSWFGDLRLRAEDRNPAKKLPKAHHLTSECGSARMVRVYWPD